MKKYIVLKTAVLSLCLLTLAGCMSPSNEVSSTNGEKSVAEAGPFGKYEPPIDVSFVRAVDDDMATNILPKTPGETIESNRWIDAYRDELGINVTYDWTVTGGYTDDTYRQKMNLTLASGDLPDIIKVDATTLKQLAQSGEIEDLTEVWDEYASDFAKETYAGEGDAVLNSAKVDGRLMAIPEMDSSLESTQYLWIRKDWLDNLGLEPPKTMQDLLEISEAFVTQDPDGNGVNDTNALILTKDLYSGWGGSEGFFAGYHAYPNMWIEKDGKLTYGSVQPEVKTVLADLAEMYGKGEIDKEFGIKEGTIVAETVAAGKAGINFGEQWNPMYPLISNYNNDENADWVPYPLVSIDDEPAKVPLRFRTQLYYAVRKGFEYPEVPVKMVNKFLETNWGEGSEFGYYYMPQDIENVGVWKFSPVTPHQATKNLDVFNAIDEARKKGTQDELEGEAKVVNDNVEQYFAGDKLQWGWNKIYGVDGAFKVMQNYQENELLLYDSFVGAPTDTMIERQATLEKLEKEVFIKIIMGEASIDEFDKFVEDWYTLGGESMTKEVNDWKDSL